MFCIQLYGKTLERVAKLSYLGVVLDKNLSWKDHVEYVSSKVSRRLGLLSRKRSCLTLEASKQYTHHSCSHYLTMLMLRGGKSQRGCCKELHRRQNSAARIMLWSNTSNDTFCVLNWLNLASRRKMPKCILVFKSLNNLVPKYLKQYFTRNADLNDHATRRSNDLHPPKA